MPHKRNPALSVLIRRAALAGPGLAATVHLAAATTVDERPDGAWHAEWAALRDLGRRTVVAASQTRDLLADLRVDAERMAVNLDGAEGIRAEQQSMAALVGAEPSATYLGATSRWIEVAVRRAETYLTVDGRETEGDDVSIPTIAGVQLSEPSAGPLLVLGPSLGTSATTLWSPTAALLAERFHVIGWDLPGHGRSTAVGDGFTMGELAAGVLTLVETVLAERGEPGGTFGYAGDSAGGAVGLQLLLDHPGRLTGAVLLCTGAKIGEPEGWHERAATVRASGTPVMVTGSAERWFAAGFLAAHSDVAAGLLSNLQHADREGYAQVCDALAGFDVRARLAEITAPVLAVAGAEDVATPPALLAEIAAGVRNGRLVVLDGVAHLAPAEAPEEVARLIVEHLGGWLAHPPGDVRGGTGGAPRGARRRPRRSRHRGDHRLHPGVPGAHHPVRLGDHLDPAGAGSSQPLADHADRPGRPRASRGAGDAHPGRPDQRSEPGRDQGAAAPVRHLLRGAGRQHRFPHRPAGLRRPRRLTLPSPSTACYPVRRENMRSQSEHTPTPLVLQHTRSPNSAPAWSTSR